MKRSRVLLALLLGVAFVPVLVVAQPAPVSITEAMKANCMAAVQQLVDTYDVASEAKTHAVSAVQQQCAFSKEVVERAVRLAAGASAAGTGCTIVNDSKNVTFIPGETCEARTARLAMTEARGGQQAASRAGGQVAYPSGFQSIEARIYSALAQGNLLLPPGDSAWDLLRSPAAAGLSNEQKRALYQEFDSQAKTCFNDALNVKPERIERARICLEAIVSVSPRWEHLDRERRRLAVAIDAVGVTAYGVDAVLSGKVPAQSAQVMAPPQSIPQQGTVGGIGAARSAGFATVEPVSLPIAAAAENPAGSDAAGIAAMERPSDGWQATPLREIPPQAMSSLAGNGDPAQQSVAAASPARLAQTGAYGATQPESLSRQGPALASATDSRPATTLSPASSPVTGSYIPAADSSSTVASPGTGRPRRIALLIANQRYTHSMWPELPNTKNDVVVVGAALQSLGFQVIESVDLNFKGMLAALNDFERKAKGADVSLIYYAGHAVQIKDKNYLIPIDADATNLFELERLSVDANDLQRVSKDAHTRLLVLDSCRENPFSGSLSGELVATRGTRGGGLTSMRADDMGGGGSMIIFSAAADQLAFDAPVVGEADNNSPFAKAFARHIVAKVALSDVIRLVGQDVRAATGGKQYPSVHDELTTVGFTLYPD